MILDVVHSPAIPAPTDQVVILADLKDLDGETVSATVSFGTDSNSGTGRTVIPMTDRLSMVTAMRGTEFSGRGCPLFPTARVVDFYITATDGTHSRTWPGPSNDSGDQGANALFQVEANPLESDQGLPVYRLILSPDEDAEFDYDNFDEASNAQMNATLVAKVGDDTDVRYLAGVRRRGAGSRRRDPRTMRLNLAADRRGRIPRK